MIRNSQTVFSGAVKKILKKNPSLKKEISQGCFLYGTVLTISLGHLSAFASESLDPPLLYSLLADVKKALVECLVRFPCIVSETRGLYISCLFTPDFSADMFMQESWQAAREVINVLSGNNIVKPQAGMATGRVMAGMLYYSHISEFLITGKAVNLSRHLADDCYRFACLALLDDECGKQIPEARILDYYRVPGFDVLYHLYGYNTEKISSEVKEHYAAGLKAIYLDRDTEKARRLFSLCLEAFPGDTPSAVMLYKCSLPAAAISVKGYR